MSVSDSHFRILCSILLTHCGCAKNVDLVQLRHTVAICGYILGGQIVGRFVTIRSQFLEDKINDKILDIVELHAR